MHPPDELMVDNFLPAMRVLVARRLRGEGLSQGRIAALLGVTQASVSLYFSGRRERAVRLLGEIGVGEEEGERFASLLAEDIRRDPVYAVNTLMAIWSGILGKGALCEAHRGMYPSLAQCDACMKLYGRQEGTGEGSIEHVARAVRLVEDSSAFVRVMPEVSVNIAFVPGDARSADGVVAVPGRIVRAHGMPRSFMRPEFGASSHLAEVLLEVRSRKGGVRAAMNMKYDVRMGRALKGMGLRPLVVGPPYPSGRDPVLEAFRQRIRDGRGFDVLVDEGGAGFEPSLYLFSEDAIRVARLALRIAHAYAA